MRPTRSVDKTLVIILVWDRTAEACSAGIAHAEERHGAVRGLCVCVYSLCFCVEVCVCGVMLV